MRRSESRVCLALAALVLCACRSQPASQTAVTAKTSPAATAEPQAKGGSATPDAKAAPRPAPAVRLTAAREAGALAIRVQNRAAEPVELAPTLEVQRAAADGFAPLAGAKLALAAGADCLRLLPGAELRPEGWPSGDPSLADGTYRVVLHGCADSYRIDSEPFEVR